MLGGVLGPYRPVLQLRRAWVRLAVSLSARLSFGTFALPLLLDHMTAAGAAAEA